MKKIFKRRSSAVDQQVDLDMAGMINKMQQQLVSLEQKIDTLINRSPERHFEGRQFLKPSQRFDRPNRQGRERQGNRFERRFYQVICEECKKECEVPFKPSQDRPVYCKECFSKRKGGSSFSEKFDTRPKERDFNSMSHSNEQQGDEGRRFDKKKSRFPRRKKERS